MPSLLSRLRRKPDPDDLLEDRDAARLDANLAALRQHDTDADRIFPASPFTAARGGGRPADQLAAQLEAYATAKHAAGQMHLWQVLFDLEGVA
jgi:hypothetical protein